MWFMVTSAALCVFANAANLLHRGACAYARVKRRK
jgi:uncharacterized protein (DUF488 family)